jgi:hypothetical protein
MGIKKQTEKTFMEAVIRYAKLMGWEVYHTHDSRRSQAGYPDLTMVRNGELIFAELKLDNGKLTEDQLKWFRLLTACTSENVCAVVWRPSDWKDIEVMLK